MKQEASVQELREEFEQIKTELGKFALWAGFAIGFLTSVVFLELLGKA
jgi:hypothetical protein